MCCGPVERYPGVVELSAALYCERGYELALAAALAQYPGTLAVSSSEDQWSVLAALRSAGSIAGPTAGARAARSRTRPECLSRSRAAGRSGDGRRRRPSRARSCRGRRRLRLTRVPDTFEGLAVMRDGSYYRPSTGQLGLAAGVPAALVIERRARLEALVERLDAVRAREARENAAAAGARARSESLAAVRAGATAALEAAATALDEARRRAASAAVERRGADERAQRLDEALAAARSEAASLDAELAALAERVVAWNARRQPHKVPCA